MSEALPSISVVRKKVHAYEKKNGEGTFQFDGLSKHLTEYQCPKSVSVSEDTTRIVTRVDCDPQANRCVGFVLLFNLDAFLATLYESIATYFEQENRSKSAYLYMAQPVLDGSPPFVWHV